MWRGLSHEFGVAQPNLLYSFKLLSSSSLSSISNPTLLTGPLHTGVYIMLAVLEDIEVEEKGYQETDCWEQGYWEINDALSQICSIPSNLSSLSLSSISNSTLLTGTLHSGIHI